MQETFLNLGWLGAGALRGHLPLFCTDSVLPLLLLPIIEMKLLLYKALLSCKLDCHFFLNLEFIGGTGIFNLET